MHLRLDTPYPASSFAISDRLQNIINPLFLLPTWGCKNIVDWTIVDYICMELLLHFWILPVPSSDQRTQVPSIPIIYFAFLNHHCSEQKKKMHSTWMEPETLSTICSTAFSFDSDMREKLTVDGPYGLCLLKVEQWWLESEIGYHCGWVLGLFCPMEEQSPVEVQCG